MTNTDTTRISASRQPGAAILTFLAFACLLTDGMGLALLLGADYLTFGYRAVGDLGATGIKIIGLPKYLLALSFIAWAVMLVLLLYRVVKRRKPSLKRALGWGLGLGILALLVSPSWMDMSIEHYSAPGQSTRLESGNALFPLLAYRAETSRESPSGDAADSQPGYLCTQSQNWKLLGLTLTRTFYPSLDEPHQAQLIHEFCTPLNDGP